MPRRGWLQPASPAAIYLVLSGAYALFFNLVLTVNLVFQTQEAGLSPFRLVLVGTVLEATRFLCEVPTGVIADVVSRKLSILIGLVLVGAGLMLGGAFPRFETILLAQVIWGCGYTFISGAKEAWIADEAREGIGRLYLRGAQVEQAVRLLAIPIAVALATVTLNLPILLGGALFFPLAFLMLIAMPEERFKSAGNVRQVSVKAMRSTFLSGGKQITGSPLLMTIVAIATLYTMASEASERLWVAHFLDNLGFPSFGHLQPVVWFGVIRMGSSVLGLVAVQLVHSSIDTTSHAAVSRALFVIYALQMASFFVFGLAQGFFVGTLAFCSVVALSRAYMPLNLAWISQNTDSNVRATVISMNRQAEAIGEITGGPPIGAIGSLVGIRAALLTAGVLMAPGLGLYSRALTQGRPQPLRGTAE
jgi:MFS transporter, DHA3 family, tetracycline resistance protein